MKITDLTPSSAQFSIKHPVTMEPLATDAGDAVVINLVGRDSDEYYAYQKDFFRKVRELHAQSGLSPDEELPKDIMDDLITDNLVCCIVGWDEKVNPFFAPLDDKGEGEYSVELVKRIVTEPQLQWLRNQLDTFISERENFFGG